MERFFHAALYFLYKDWSIKIEKFDLLSKTLYDKNKDRPSVCFSKEELLMSLKEEIIEASYDLFAEKGYEKTTVSEIIEKAGSSKGGFYHHFKSKEEILEAITFSYVNEVKIYYDEILADEELTFVEKFTESYYKVNQIKRDHLPEWPKMKKMYAFEGNHVLLKKMADQFENITMEFYRNLIIKGNESDIISVEYPNELASLWSREVIKFHRLAKRHFYSSDSLEDSEYIRTLKFNEQLINHQLGLEEKTIDLVSLGNDYIQSIRVAIEREEHSDDQMV